MSQPPTHSVIYRPSALPAAIACPPPLTTTCSPHARHFLAGPSSPATSKRQRRPPPGAAAMKLMRPWQDPGYVQTPEAPIGGVPGSRRDASDGEAPPAPLGCATPVLQARPARAARGGRAMNMPPAPHWRPCADVAVQAQLGMPARLRCASDRSRPGRCPKLRTRGTTGMPRPKRNEQRPETRYAAA